MLHSLLWNLVHWGNAVYYTYLPKMGELMSWYQNSCDRDRLEKVLGCPEASYTEMSSVSNKVINLTSCVPVAAVMTKSAVES